MAHFATIIPTRAATAKGIPTARGTARAAVYLLQYASHPSPLFVFPSSHSYPFCWTPSPQVSLQFTQPLL